MGTRFGIELSPVACRVVELEGRDVAQGRPPATRVRSYAVLPSSGPDTDRWFASIGRRPVAVVVWGAQSDHRHVVVSTGTYEKMRAEALASIRAAGVDTSGTMSDFAPASATIKGADRQRVVLAVANADDVSTALRPLVEARLRIRSVITPADALLGLARSRPALVPGGIEAYVALDATATCIALVRGGSLLAARELPWGHESRGVLPAAPHDAEALRRRDDLAARLADELADFLMMIGARHEHDAITQVSICGGLPDLRTMTVPLMERLDVEVETLDSLFGIDTVHLPEPADEFREQAAELRLAWAAAADWRGPINLMRHRRHQIRRAAFVRAAVAAGVFAGLGAGWAIEQSAWWRSTGTKPIVRRAPTPIVPAPSSAPARANGSPRPEAPPVAVSIPPSAPPTVSPAPVPPPLVARVPAPVPAASNPPVAVAPAPTVTVASAPAVTGTPTSPATVAQRPAGTVATAKPTPVLPVTPTPPVRRPSPVPPRATTTPLPPAARRADPSPLPFDAVLGTILYSPDRKFAIVNGRIVGPGDEVNGAKVVDITPTTVLLRDAQGRLRSLTVRPGGATPSAPE